MATEDEIASRYRLMGPLLDERQTRLWAGIEAIAHGRGGRELVARATKLSRTTVLHGLQEVRRGGEFAGLVKVRRRGAGRPKAEVKQPGLLEALEALVDPVTRGDPESALRWTCKSTRKLSAELGAQGFQVSQHTVGQLLHQLGYSLQATHKTLEGESHPDRNAQFEHINAAAEDFQARGQPVVSVDAKKKELVGEFHRPGQEWQPKGAPVLTQSHDFPTLARGKAIPYGVYDVGANEAWVSVGMDHDTPVFAVNSLHAWWTHMGRALYPEAHEVLVAADSGGSNSARSRVWKARLQQFANETGLAVHVVHFPPGTSKWNKIEHRLFSHISMNWRGRPLEDYETVVQLIGATRTQAGLRVKARLDKRAYPTGVSVPKATMAALNLTRADFHGEWNYVIRPCSAA